MEFVSPGNAERSPEITVVIDVEGRGFLVTGELSEEPDIDPERTTTIRHIAASIRLLG